MRYLAVAIYCLISWLELSAFRQFILEKQSFLILFLNEEVLIGFTLNASESYRDRVEAVVSLKALPAVSISPPC
jgi:hypothetical protein